MSSSSYAAIHATPGFGIENLPYASFSTKEDEWETFYLGTRIGNRVLKLKELARLFPDLSPIAAKAVCDSTLDTLLAASPQIWTEVRVWITAILESGDARLIDGAAYDVSKVRYQLAFSPADYVDYYASEHHATNLGHMFRPNEEPLKPNWKHLPIGYHGRSGTVCVSGTDIVRPKGLLPPAPDSKLPSYGPTKRLDIEAEIGFVLGNPAPAGKVSVEKAAKDHIFGVFLFNDWSARDIQNYEYVPLGPYLGKSFASTVGAWVVPWAALEAARVQTPERTYPLASYLDEGDKAYGLDITMGITVNGEEVSRPPFGLMYYSAPQMVAHMTINGASLRPGDMFGSGTVSGPEKDQRGSFIELSWGGKEPIKLSDGTSMTFLEDGQLIGLTGTAPGPHGSVIDFGECLGRIVEAN